MAFHPVAPGPLPSAEAAATLPTHSTWNPAESTCPRDMKDPRARQVEQIGNDPLSMPGPSCGTAP
jgi:hypothetical protein